MWHNPLRLVLALYLVAASTAVADAQTLAGTSTGKAEGSEPIDTPEKAKRLCDVEISSAQSRGRKNFSATEILDLDFRIVLRRQLAGEHLLRLEVFTPNGHLYQTLTVPFTADRMSTKALRKVAGFPRPLALQPVEKIVSEGKAAQAVVARLPVGGTPIVHAGLYGSWSVQAFLDDERESCGRTVSFRIKP